MTSDPGPFISLISLFLKQVLYRGDSKFICRRKLTSPNFLKCKVCLDFVTTEDCIQINVLFVGQLQ